MVVVGLLLNQLCTRKREGEMEALVSNVVGHLIFWILLSTCCFHLLIHSQRTSKVFFFNLFFKGSLLP